MLIVYLTNKDLNHCLHQLHLGFVCFLSSVAWTHLLLFGHVRLGILGCLGWDALFLTIGDGAWNFVALSFAMFHFSHEEIISTGLGIFLHPVNKNNCSLTMLKSIPLIRYPPTFLDVCVKPCMNKWLINLYQPIWVFQKIVVPQNGLFIMENPIKMDDLGHPYFLETPIYIIQLLKKFAPIAGEKTRIHPRKKNVVSLQQKEWVVYEAISNTLPL